jgi:hypothetical protein
MEVRNIREFVGNIGVSSDDPSAIPHYSHDAAVFPVAYSLIIRQLQLPEKVSRHRATLGGELDFFNKAGPSPLLEFVELWCFR